MNIEWNDKELQQALSDLITKMPTQTSTAITNACLAIEAEAKERCPHDTGTLRESITTDVKTQAENVVGIVGTTIEYAPYVHQGTGIYAREGNGRKEVPWCYYSEKEQKLVFTKGTKPTPFLEEAVETVQPQIVDYFREVLGDA